MLLNTLRFGALNSPKSRWLFEEVVSGIAGYGNSIGVPTVGGEVYFHPSYENNPLVNAMCVGLLKHEDLAKGVASGVGNPVMIVGAKTGRDGIHGASFSSEDLGATEERGLRYKLGILYMENYDGSLSRLIKTGNVVGMQDMGSLLTSSS